MVVSNIPDHVILQVLNTVTPYSLDHIIKTSDMVTLDSSIHTVPEYPDMITFNFLNHIVKKITGTAIIDSHDYVDHIVLKIIDKVTLNSFDHIFQRRTLEQ